jgi:hypothetical protein
MKRKRATRKRDSTRKAVPKTAHAQAIDTFDYRSWLELALKAPLNPKPRFRSEDELWT